MISREESLELLNRYLKNKNLLNHCFAVEAILGACASRLGEDVELWSQTGLLHDLDYDYTKDRPEQHALMTAELIEGLVPDEAIHAILSHNFQHSNVFPEEHLDKALIASDAVSGLLIASALVMPSKSLLEVTPDSVMRKFKDKSFAAGCERKRILLCEEVGFSLQDFISLSLESLQKIHEVLGL